MNTGIAQKSRYSAAGNGLLSTEVAVTGLGRERTSPARRWNCAKPSSAKNVAGTTRPNTMSRIESVDMVRRRGAAASMVITESLGHQWEIACPECTRLCYDPFAEYPSWWHILGS